jgi:hypothetical protein
MTDDVLRAELYGAAVMAEMQLNIIRTCIGLEIDRTDPPPHQDTIDALRRIEKSVTEFHHHWIGEIDRLANENGPPGSQTPSNP